jgi:hypothetical protein
MGPNEIEYILCSKLYLLLARCARLNWQRVTVAASTPRGGRLGRSGRGPPPTSPVLLTGPGVCSYSAALVSCYAPLTGHSKRRGTG